MSADLYPAAIWERFSHPRWVLAENADVRELARASTPASVEMAVLYADAQNQWFWRGHASPWLVAVLETLCAAHNRGDDLLALGEALNQLELPPVKRYCRAMADELWQAALQA